MSAKAAERVLKFVEGYYAESGGVPPTMRQIADGADVSSTSQVSYYLRGLVRDGKLRRRDGKYVPVIPTALGLNGHAPTFRGARPRVEFIQVVRVAYLVGAGIEDDPRREVTAYYDEGGTLLFEFDPTERAA